MDDWWEEAPVIGDRSCDDVKQEKKEDPFQIQNWVPSINLDKFDEVVTKARKGLMQNKYNKMILDDLMADMTWHGCDWSFDTVRKWVYVLNEKNPGMMSEVFMFRLTQSICVEKNAEFREEFLLRWMKDLCTDDDAK